MKRVSGSVISSKPISLSKAASVLNSFVSADTGASQAVSAYLRRASASFNEMFQLHRELKVGRSERKRKKTPLETLDNGNLTDVEKSHREDGLATATVERGRILDFGEEQSLRHSRNSEGGDMDDRGTKSGRKEKKKESDYRPEVEEREGRGIVEIEWEKSKERKKRKKAGVENGGLDDSEERHSRIKKRRKHEGPSNPRFDGSSMGNLEP